MSQDNILEQTKVYIYILIKNRRQEGKTGPFWRIGTHEKRI
jgi:hypothetical protein